MTNKLGSTPSEIVHILKTRATINELKQKGTSA